RVRDAGAGRPGGADAGAPPTACGGAGSSGAPQDAHPDDALHLSVALRRHSWTAMAATGRYKHDSALNVWNDTRGAVLVEQGRIARSFWSRARGLLGTGSLPEGQGLLIERCSSIHSF